ncbi:hypothetical protein M422DRAFT_782026 [Sphaerobolus stellatus SS14]|uniref:Extracellular membrane protein CFEM domain-containing protein n=1 Tax=Sphaerobolus stellatus (strain SS14) TaxID=990650 RepID=A0A0C9UQM0_SPHS4|nr:hypothetical protein M422DRAFT_782026 [Sphaerobolus stellatus SS14]
MRFSTLIVASALLVSQALAAAKFNVTINNANNTIVQALEQSVEPGGAGTVPANCTQQCQSILTTFKACDQTDVSCICTNNTAIGLENCQQCLFTALLVQNIRPSNPLVGSATLLSAFSTSCNKTDFPKLALNLTADWDGPQSLHLNSPINIIAVIAAAIIGMSSFYILWNIE